MARPQITWIHLFTYGHRWSAVVQRNGSPKHYHSPVTYSSRQRLADLIDSLSRSYLPPHPHLVVRPTPAGWCAYPDPEGSKP